MLKLKVNCYSLLLCMAILFSFFQTNLPQLESKVIRIASNESGSGEGDCSPHIRVF